MSKWLGWLSGRSSPQAAASSASPADNIPQAPLDNPLYISDEPSLSPEAVEAEPQEAHAASNAEVDLYGHDDKSDGELHDAPSSDSDDDPAAAAASAPSPDSKDAAKDLDEARAKAAATSLMKFFEDIQTRYENSHQRISDALSALPPQPLYQTSGAHKAQDRMQLARQKAQEIEAVIRTDKEGVDAALKELKPLQPKDSATLIPQDNSLGALGYLGIVSAALLTGGVVLGGGAVVLSSIAVPFMGYSFTASNVVACTYSVLQSISFVTPLAGGGVLAGGITATEVKKAIEDQGDITGVIKKLQKMQLQITQALEKQDQEITKIIQELDEASAALEDQIEQYAAQLDTKVDLDMMAKKDAVEILQGNKADIMALLARSVKIYSKTFGEADAEKYTTILVYTIIDPRGSLPHDTDEDSLQVMTNTAHDHVGINIRDIASLLYQNDHEKQNVIIYNVAKYLMQQSYRLRDGSGYDMEEFAENPIAKECADILRQTPADFAEEIASALNPPLTVESSPHEDSHAMVSPEAVSQFAYQGDLLDGGDWAFSASALGEVYDPEAKGQ